MPRMRKKEDGTLLFEVKTESGVEDLMKQIGSKIKKSKNGSAIDFYHHSFDKDSAGVYAWKYILKGKQKEECLYVGQTKDITQRLSSYVWAHQIRSIDDSKIGVALRYLKPKSVLVYFYKFSKDDDLHKEELKKIKELKPHLNNLGKYSKDKTTDKLKEDIHKAFAKLLKYQLKKKLKSTS